MSRKLEVVKAVIAAWSAGDLEGALAHMDEDIVWHYLAAVAPPLRGKAKARKFMQNFRGSMGEVRWRIFDSAETGDRLFVEGVDEYFTPEGVRVASPYAGVLEFKGDLICAWRDYVDLGVMDAQKAGQPAPAWVDALIDRPAI